MAASLFSQIGERIGLGSRSPERPAAPAVKPPPPLPVFDALAIFDKSGALYLFAGVGCLALGIKCYDSFFQCDYVQINNHSDWSTPAGYTIPQFIALLIGTYALPLGLMLVLVYSVQSYKSPFWAITPVKVLVYLTLSALSACATYGGYKMGKQIIDCGIYCVGNEATTDATNDAAVVSTGVLYFIVGLALTALFLALALLSVFSAAQDNSGGKGVDASSASGAAAVASAADTKPLLPLVRDPAEVKSMGIKHKSAQTLRNRAKNAYTVVALALTFGFVYPVFFFSCTALPTWWAYFTKHGIQAYESSVPPKTYGAYWSLEIGQNLILKLYPDILIYYGAIYLVAGVAVVAQSFPSVYHRLSKKPSRLGGLSVGEFALAVLLVVLLVGQFFYWYFDHGWENEDRDKRSSAEIAARSVGQVANMVTGLLVLPVTRNSVWTVLLGVSWENLVAYHQILGYLLLLLVLTHMFLWWSVYAQQGTFPHDILAVPMKYHKDNFTVPLAVVSSVLMFLVMGGLSLPVVRRLHYDLFYWSHHLSLGLFLMMLWHSTMSWYYIAAGLTLWAADHALRLYHCLGTSVRVERATVEGDGNIVHLSYSVSRPQSILSLRNPFSKTAYATLEHSAGQYCYINIPQVSQLAWHPFTISSTPSDSSTHHHIKSMGQDQWTERLLLVVRGIDSGHGGAEPSLAYLNRRISVNIDGPYGIPLDPSPYRCALLVAGGIGITPLYATFKQWYESSRGADRFVILFFSFFSFSFGRHPNPNPNPNPLTPSCKASPCRTSST